jgi:sensor histidine kinase YesM
VAYLRAAVPRLNESTTTLGQELQLVKAYLELMHMRMPDRLLFVLHVDEAVETLECRR